MAKRSVGKPGRGGRKWAVRHRDAGGTALSERISLTPPDPGPRDRELLVPLVIGGEIVGRRTSSVARERHRAALAELPPYALQLSRGYPAIPTVFEPGTATSEGSWVSIAVPGVNGLAGPGAARLACLSCLLTSRRSLPCSATWAWRAR